MKLVGVKQFVSDFGSMTVNSYVVFEQNSKRAWIFDTGTECDSLLSFIEEEGLKVDSILLTHTHRDHIFCLDKLKFRFKGVRIFVHKSEKIEGASSIAEHFELVMGRLKLKALHTHGHSVGGLSYVISGLPCPVAIVGDAIFAGSMGGGMVSYQDALRTNRDKIMTLPDETVLCPGHGPITTVKEEKEHNPFFPEF
jgi:glyoxylase-like metal-dependent hydrolase (beta-lactamase superfamily II)